MFIESFKNRLTWSTSIAPRRSTFAGWRWRCWSSPSDYRRSPAGHIHVYYISVSVCVYKYWFYRLSLLNSRLYTMCIRLPLSRSPGATHTGPVHHSDFRISSLSWIILCIFSLLHVYNIQIAIYLCREAQDPHRQAQYVEWLREGGGLGAFGREDEHR